MSDASSLVSNPAVTAETYGVYRIVRPLGEGASGRVFLAERTDFAQRVALKVFHSSFLTAGLGDSATEQHLLASLDHRHIVRVLQQGVTSAGVRYLAMEYVAGDDIVTFCDARHLPTAERLRLLLQVFAAVEHAHRHLVVHGDLKPANILVSAPDDADKNVQGEAKLVDFGAGGLLGDASKTTTAHTPAFASPEQRAGGRPTVVSDIYSLGLLARRLLAEAAPRGPRRDLEAILDKALAENCDARYLTAEAMAADLRAMAEGRTPAVRRASFPEQVRKWTLRHKLGAGMAAVLLATLLFSATGIAVKAAQARRSRRETEARLRELVQLTGTLQSELYSSVRTLPHAEASEQLLTDSAAATLDKLVAAGSRDPTLRVELAGQYERLAQLEMEQAGSDPKTPARAALPRALQHLQRALDLSSPNDALRAQRARMLQELQSGQSSGGVGASGSTQTPFGNDNKKEPRFPTQAP